MKIPLLLCCLLSFNSFGQSNNCVPPPPQMSAWWTFDETSGRIARDTAGAVDNAGAYIGKPTPRAGLVGNALCFNQTNDFVLVRDQAEVNFRGSCTNGVESFTIDAWIFPDKNGPFFQTLLNKRSGSELPRGYSLFLTNGNLGFLLADGTLGSYTSVNRNLQDSQWHFIAVTVARCVDGNINQVSFYVDGNVTGFFLDRHGGDLSNTNDLLIGGSSISSAQDKYLGCIDELEFYKRALSTNELGAIFNAGPAGKCKCVSSLSLVCSNITINCGSPVPTNPPAVFSSCCSNVLLSMIGSVTNGSSCSQTISQLWQATCSSNFAICTQTVTVVSVPPTLICSNITIPCGSIVPTNPPIASSPCCTNLIPFLLTTGSNANSGFISQIWQVTDCCGNVATCTQTVTIGFSSSFIDPGGLLSGFESALLPPSHDNTNSGRVPTCFSFCFCGNTYSNVWVNEDGNVTLEGPFGGHQPASYDPATPLCELRRPIFAPFWTDVDTLAPGSGSVGWGCNCAFVPGTGTRPAFGVTWRGVGYYKGHADKTNSFQMLIIDRSDRGPGSFDLQYRYERIQWDAADSNFGIGGFCDFGAGVPARAGYSKGTNCCFELPGSGECDALMDTGANSLVTGHSAGSPNGVYTWQFTNCAPAGGF